MARHKVTVQRASEDELTDLASWYHLTGPGMPNEPDEDLNERHVKAFRSGVLGSALELPMAATCNRLFDSGLDMTARFLARTLVSSVRLDGQTIGMLVMAPPQSLYEKAIREVAGASQKVIDQVLLGTLVMLSKLQIVSISAEHRGRGLGSRLVRQAVDVASKSMVGQVYGQFRTLEGLAPFYTKLGFDVVSDDTLPIAAGYQLDLYRKPDETFFSRILQLNVRTG
ncbi:GNAT family N-acetyltransferase [Mycobacterium sp. SMC-11]|uniref:GNAT family N-acetyltransferase n=1 Tax=Mycobacterium sp. SMC-11 TaxID=3385969 RepID=UPI00390C4ED2